MLLSLTGLGTGISTEIVDRESENWVTREQPLGNYRVRPAAAAQNFSPLQPFISKRAPDRLFNRSHQFSPPELRLCSGCCRWRCRGNEN